MVDFRYHALSLVAVFLALGIGIVLGVDGRRLARVRGGPEPARLAARRRHGSARAGARRSRSSGAQPRRGDRARPLPSSPRAGCAGQRVALIAARRAARRRRADSVEEAGRVGGRRARASGVVYDAAGLRRHALGAPAQQLGARRPLARVGRRQSRARERADRRWTAARRGGLLPRSADASPRTTRPRASSSCARRSRTGSSRGCATTSVGVEAMDTDPSQVGWYADQDDRRASTTST